MEFPNRRRACIPILILLLTGCLTKTTPPGPSSIGGNIDGAAYSYHSWDEGLNVMLWHDLAAGSESCSSTSSTENPLFRMMCSVAAQDGRHFAWELHTEDGITADFWIDFTAYDLSQGRLFLIRWQDEGLIVDQLERNFNGLDPEDRAAVEALAIDDPDIAAFIQAVNLP